MKIKTLRIILGTMTILSFVLAVYCIVVSIKGNGGSGALPAALGLTALGNIVNLYSLRKNRRKEKGERRNDMGFEFDESEMYPCDICGEFWPMGEMYELEDGRVVCPDCMEEENGD